MLSLTEAYPSGDASGRRHKALDHAALGRAFLRATPAAEGDAALKAAFDAACAEAPSPVCLDFAGPSRATSGRAGEANEARGDAQVLPPAIRHASRPALIVGSVALRWSFGERLSRLRIPVFTTPAAKGVLDEGSTFSAGVFTGDGKAATPEKRILPLADAVFGIGVRSGEVLSPSQPHPNFAGVDVAPQSALFPEPAAHHRGQLTSEGDIAEALDALEKHEWGASEIAESKRELAVALRREDAPLIDALLAAADVTGAARHVLDTGNFTVLLEHLLPSRDGDHVLGTPNGRFMGAALGYALGSAIAAPQRPIVLWVGDGGLQPALSELPIAVDLGLPLLVIVVTDGFFGSIAGRAVEVGWTLRPLTLPNRHVTEVASVHGFQTARASSADELVDQLVAFIANPRPSLIEWRVEPLGYRRAASLLR